MDGSSRRRIAASLVAVVLALAAAPGASASTAVTVADPAGPRVVTTEQLDRMTSILRRGEPPETSERSLRAEALDFLMGPLWREGAARELGVTFTDAELNAGFERYKRDGAPTDADLRAFRRQSGFSLTDLKGFSRDIMFMSALEELVLGPAAATVTDAAIDAYLAEHGPEMQPERRDFRYLVVTTRAQAVRARAALQRGATWSQVGRRYAVERKAWRLRDVPKDAYGLGLDRAAFRAPRGRLVGPVKARADAYYVLKVTRIRPAHALPVKQNRRLVRERLLHEAEERIETAWAATTATVWKARTTCAPEFDWFPRCGNWDGTKVRLQDFIWLD